MTRRHDDPEDAEGPLMRRATANGLPLWVKIISVVGLPGFLVLYLLGAVPFLPSPLLANQVAVTEHENTTRSLLEITRSVCRGVWQHNPEAAKQCDK